MTAGIPGSGISASRLFKATTGSKVKKTDHFQFDADRYLDEFHALKNKFNFDMNENGWVVGTVVVCIVIVAAFLWLLVAR
ncbi:hypothetical protein D3C85_1807600 [compost metagenome]